MRIVCAWCLKHIRGSGEKISHGICEDCLEKMKEEGKKKEIKSDA